MLCSLRDACLAGAGSFEGLTFSQDPLAMLSIPLSQPAEGQGQLLGPTAEAASQQAPAPEGPPADAVHTLRPKP